MPICKWWEMSCETCGGGEYFPGTRVSAVEQAQEREWILKKGKAFCTYYCWEKFEKRGKKDE